MFNFWDFGFCEAICRFVVECLYGIWCSKNRVQEILLDRLFLALLTIELYCYHFGNIVIILVPHVKLSLEGGGWYEMIVRFLVMWHVDRKQNKKR